MNCAASITAGQRRSCRRKTGGPFEIVVATADGDGGAAWDQMLAEEKVHNGDDREPTI
jgi:hypothetical protein